MLVHIFHLAGKHMGHGHLHCGGQINDGFVFRIRLPHVQNRVADFQCIFGLCLGKALRTVLKGEGPFRCFMASLSFLNTCSLCSTEVEL